MQASFNKDKNTCKTLKNQAFDELVPLHPDFLKHIDRAFQEHFTPNKRVALNRMVEHIQKNGIQHKPQKYWAKIFGVSDRTANVWINLFESLGFIVRIKGKKLGGYKTDPDAYKISQYFSFPDARSRFSKYIPSLKYFSLALLAVTSLFSCGGVLANENYVSASYKEKVIRILRLNKGVSRTQVNILKHSNWNGAMDFENVIPDYIQRLSCLEFTRAGMVRLIPYPADALEYAQRCLTTTKKFVKSPFAYFIALCDQYCRDYDITPNWRALELAQKAFHFKNSDAMVTSNVVHKRGISKKARAIKSSSLSAQNTAIQSPSPQILKREQVVTLSDKPQDISTMGFADALRVIGDRQEAERRRNAQMQYAKPQGQVKTSGSVQRRVPQEELEALARTRKKQKEAQSAPKTQPVYGEAALKRFNMWNLDIETFKPKENA